jgi:hypothetical protein
VGYSNSQSLVSKEEIEESKEVKLLEETKGEELAGEKHWQVSCSSPPGWIDVKPIYLFIERGSPKELPHNIEVVEDSASDSKKVVRVREGKYLGEKAEINASELVDVRRLNLPATAKFNIAKGEFWYGNEGPVKATTDEENPTPTGKYDIEIPDFQHNLGRAYGDYGTTWFRIGHSGDRYLHPGRVSLGCTTILDISEWPKIWRYLISSRKDPQSVGELEVTS